MMGSYYADSNEVGVLRERIEELSRIRQGFAAHLGSSLYEATKDDPDLRWGRESLYDGISACDSERERLLKRIEKMSNESSVEPAPEPTPTPAPEPAAVSELTPTPEPAAVPEPELAPAPTFEPIPAPEPLPAPEPVSSPAVTTKLEPDMTVVNPVASQQESDKPKCPTCGAPVRPNDMFCMSCGANLSEARQKPSNVCPHCGAPIEPGFKFCMTCGKSLA